MRELKETPPPLTYSPSASDRERESTADCTPISTPVSTTASVFGPPRPRNKDRDLYFSWAKKPVEPESAFLESDILFDDTGDSSFPLFPSSPPKRFSHDMDTAPVPIDITSPPRFNSQSPRTSNLTAALQEADASGNRPGAVDVAQRNGNDGGRLSVTRLDSIGNGISSSYYGSGARQIPGVRDKPRRESSASSFANGMSWGGVSVGSWVRDDILMTGTSPYAFHQSPSFHSSSYLPKMEANFLKDYSCCGITLDSLHELLQHYEENHAQSSSQILQRPQAVQGAAGGGARPSSTSTGVVAAQASQVPGSQSRSQAQPNQQIQTIPQQRVPLPPVQDVDSLDDMEMDDENLAPPTPLAQSFGFSNMQSQPDFSQAVPQVAPLNMNLANAMQTHQAMRSSNPSTPASAVTPGFNFNASISSVNTPSFTTPTSGVQRSPDSSIPGTPQATDFNEMPLGQDFSAMNLNIPLDTASLNAMIQDPNWANMNFGLDNTVPPMNMTIDEPAKRLFSKTGGQLTQQQLQYALRTGQLGDDENMQKLIAQQMQGRSTTGGLLGDQENKPFRCPVIGCEKAYKNQNGLKYHKQHGHQNQQLKSNPDGTFSIVDPVTSIPYPGTLGMEKEKPYRCEVCGKRYKNLNGLKYHRQHSPPCNPELKVNLPNLAGVTAQSVNVAGAGLMGGEVGGMY